MPETSKELKDRYIRTFTEQKEHFERLAQENARVRDRCVSIGGLSLAGTSAEYFTKSPLLAIIVTGVYGGANILIGFGAEKDRKKAVKGARHKQRNIYELHEGLEPTSDDDFTEVF